jgi:hypothetical protein
VLRHFNFLECVFATDSVHTRSKLDSAWRDARSVVLDLSSNAANLPLHVVRGRALIMTLLEARKLVAALRRHREGGVSFAELHLTYFQEPRPHMRTLQRWLGLEHAPQTFDATSLASMSNEAAQKLIAEPYVCSACAPWQAVRGQVGSENSDVEKYYGTYWRFRKTLESESLSVNKLRIEPCAECHNPIAVMPTKTSDAQNSERRGGVWIMRSFLVCLFVDNHYMAHIQVGAVPNPKRSFMSGTLSMSEWQPVEVPMACRFALASVETFQNAETIRPDIEKILKNETKIEGVVSGRRTEPRRS